MQLQEIPKRCTADGTATKSLKTASSPAVQLQEVQNREPAESYKAKEFESERAVVSRRENRFDAGEVILEIALIVCSLTLLTKRKTFWYSGIAIGVVGFFVGLSGFLIR